MQQWLGSRSYDAGRFPPERVAAERSGTISICLPVRNEAATLGPIVERLVALRDGGVVDQVVVVDSASADGCAELAQGLGAEVHQEAELFPELGQVLGKGDAMWRALAVLSGEIVCYLDADSEDLDARVACALCGPIACGEGVDFVKGAYGRPFRVEGVELPDGGGRVTELTARPLLNLLYPELAGFRQPLAGEVAASRGLLERLPFATGYAVEIAMLIDAWALVGLDAMAQVDIGTRQNRHQPLPELAPMAYSVVRAVATRLEREGRLTGAESAEALELLAPVGTTMELRAVPLSERPPLAPSS